MKASPELPSLRERKKQKTRAAIADVATRLFIARGFDHVTLQEVAAEAEVSVNTIFNYFTTKEELFFDLGDMAKAQPARIVRGRAPGESALDALERVLRESGKTRREHVDLFMKTIEQSPALLARERLLFQQSEDLLAQALLEGAGDDDDAKARIAAAMITSLEWTLLREFRARLLKGESERRIRAALEKLADAGFKALRGGLGTYCKRSRR